MLWADHCVQDTFGAAFATDLNIERIDRIICKGTDPDIDSYSGFFDNARRKSTELHAFLRDSGVSEVHLVGLATDYCVKYTALDAIDLGYRTIIHSAGGRGVNLTSDDDRRALQEMHTAGAEIT